MNDFFINQDIYLRPLEPEDLDVLYQWENDTALWQYGASIVPLSRFALRQYIADSQLDVFQIRQLRMMVVRKLDDVPVGIIDFYDFDALNSRAGIGILIDKDFQQKGYGWQALQSIREYAFGRLKLHQLYAFVPEKNQPSIALFAKAGYTRTAVLKDWVSTEKGFADVVVMQLVSCNP